MIVLVEFVGYYVTTFSHLLLDRTMLTVPVALHSHSSNLFYIVNLGRANELEVYYLLCGIRRGLLKYFEN